MSVCRRHVPRRLRPREGVVALSERQPPHKVFMSRTQTQTRRPQAAPLSPPARQHAAGSMSCFCKTLPAADTHARLHIRTLRRCGMLHNASGMYLTASFHPLPPATSHQPTLYRSDCRRERMEKEVWGRPKASVASGRAREAATDACECAREACVTARRCAPARFARWTRDGESSHGERHKHAARRGSDVSAHRRKCSLHRYGALPWLYRGTAAPSPDRNR